MKAVLKMSTIKNILQEVCLNFKQRCIPFWILNFEIFRAPISQKAFR